MQRDDFVKIIKNDKYYSKLFNDCNEFIKFPSSFGVCQNENQKWMFYEIDEREHIFEKKFDSELKAFMFAFKRYGLKIPPIYIVPSYIVKATLNRNFSARQRAFSRRAGLYRCRQKTNSSDTTVKAQRKKEENSTIKN